MRARTAIAAQVPAKATGMAAMAQISIVVLRARLIVQPARMSRDESQPPATLPTSDRR